MIKGYSMQTFDEFYVDFDTNNTSFLKIALILDGKGISNNYFFLKLYNKKLRNINPYDDDLTDEEKLMVYKESAENRWYFFREVFRVEAQGYITEVGGGIPFMLNRGNLAYLWANELNLSTYMILPRQFGKTWAAIADAVYTHQFNKNTSIIHFNKSQGDSNDNITRIKTAIGMLPLYMQHSNDDIMEAKDKRKTKNNEKFVRNILNSTLVAMASASNEAKADSAARGKTAAKIWFDEFGFLFFNKAIYEATSPVFDKASRSAKESGIPYGISITTTPGDLVTPHGEYAYKFMQDCVTFDESMYDYKLKKLFRQVLDSPHKRPFLFIQFQYWQLGETDEWFNEVAKKLGDPLRVRREYLLEWINSNGRTPFDVEDLEVVLDLAKSRQDEFDIITINKFFQMKVYEVYKGKKPVIISVDVASGIGRDSSAVVVINPETLRPMAVFRSNMITSVHLKRFLIKLVTKYYTNSIVTIESNSIGTMLINELRETPVNRHLYKYRKKRVVEDGINNFSKKRTRETIAYGHYITGDSKAKMMEMLESMVKHNKSYLGIPEIAEEIKFMELRDGQIKHSSATHDDVTMAYLGGLYIVKFGTGMKGKGIYFTIQDDDEDEYLYDDVETSIKLRRIDQYVLYYDDNEDSEYLRNMTEEYEVETSSTLAKKERKEYLKQMDIIDGIDDEDEIVLKINPNIQKLMLRNINMMNGYEDENDDIFEYARSPFDNTF